MDAAPGFRVAEPAGARRLRTRLLHVRRRCFVGRRRLTHALQHLSPGHGRELRRGGGRLRDSAATEDHRSRDDDGRYSATDHALVPVPARRRRVRSATPTARASAAATATHSATAPPVTARSFTLFTQAASSAASETPLAS